MIKIKYFALDGTSWDRAPVDSRGCLKGGGDGQCCECLQPPGEEHEEGCDWEQCPRCGGQFLSCDCPDDEVPRYTADEARTTAKLLLDAVASVEAPPCAT